MPTRRRPTVNSPLSQEAVRSIIAKEALLKAGALPTGGMGTGLSHRLGFASQGSWSDSSIECVKRPIGDDESLRRLYAEFEAEDRALANAGLSDYKRMLADIDGE